ncbi:MAG: hypothetical protein AAF480_01355 [Actinomycetota bacterium]
MADETFGFDETPFLEPAPDEEAWEAYLEFALERLGADGGTGLTNRQLAVVEDELGHELPYEVGLLLVMGVPDDEGWLDWRDDPDSQLARWDAEVLGGIVFGIRENAFWSPTFGPRPEDIDDRVAAAEAAYDGLPRLFPLYRDRAVPLMTPDGFDSASGNPVLSVAQTDVVEYGSDLADWLHKDFDVPLPTWERTGERRFPFWSELTTG